MNNYQLSRYPIEYPHRVSKMILVVLSIMYEYARSDALMYDLESCLTRPKHLYEMVELCHNSLGSSSKAWI